MNKNSLIWIVMFTVLFSSSFAAIYTDYAQTGSQSDQDPFGWDAGSQRLIGGESYLYTGGLLRQPFSVEFVVQSVITGNVAPEVAIYRCSTNSTTCVNVTGSPLGKGVFVGTTTGVKNVTLNFTTGYPVDNWFYVVFMNASTASGTSLLTYIYNSAPTDTVANANMVRSTNLANFVLNGGADMYGVVHSTDFISSIQTNLTFINQTPFNDDVFTLTTKVNFSVNFSSVASMPTTCNLSIDNTLNESKVNTSSFLGGNFTIQWNNVNIVNNGVHNNTIFCYNSESPGNFTVTNNWNMSIHYFLVNLVDRYNSSLPITNIFANVSGTIFTNTSGSVINTSFNVNDSTLRTIIIGATNYFNRTYNNYNTQTSGNLTAQLHQAELYLNATEIISNRSVRGNFFTPLLNGTGLFLSAGTYNIIFSTPGYYNKTQTFTVAALSNSSNNITDVYTSILNISALQGNTATRINNLNFNLTLNISPNGLNPYFISNSTTNGYMEYGLINGTYDITAYSSGNFVPQSKELNITTSYTQFNFLLFQWNTFNFSVFDEITFNPVLNATITVYGTTSAYSNSSNATNGILELTLLVPDQYAIIYGGQTHNIGFYPNRFRYFTIFNGTYNNINLYSLNLSLGIDYTITLIDQLNQPQPGKIIAARKFLPASNSYIIVQSEKANTDGKARFHLVTGSEQYIFDVLNDNTVIFSTVLSKLFDIVQTIKISTAASGTVIDKTIASWNLAPTLNFNNQTNILTLNWITLSSVSGTMCLNVTKFNATSLSTVASQCSQAINGNITINMTPYGNGSYAGQAYAQGSILSNAFIAFLIGTSQQLNGLLGTDGLIIYMLLIVVAACMTLVDIRALPFALGIVHIGAWWWGLIPLNYGISGIGIIIALTLITFRMSK